MIFSLVNVDIVGVSCGRGSLQLMFVLSNLMNWSAGCTDSRRAWSSRWCVYRQSYLYIQLCLWRGRCLVNESLTLLYRILCVLSRNQFHVVRNTGRVGWIQCLSDCCNLKSLDAYMWLMNCLHVVKSAGNTWCFFVQLYSLRCSGEGSDMRNGGSMCASFAVVI